MPTVLLPQGMRMIFVVDGSNCSRIHRRIPDYGVLLEVVRTIVEQYPGSEVITVVSAAFEFEIRDRDRAQAEALHADIRAGKIFPVLNQVDDDLVILKDARARNACVVTGDKFAKGREQLRLRHGLPCVRPSYISGNVYLSNLMYVGDGEKDFISGELDTLIKHPDCEIRPDDGPKQPAQPATATQEPATNGTPRTDIPADTPATVGTLPLVQSPLPIESRADSGRRHPTQESDGRVESDARRHADGAHRAPPRESEEALQSKGPTAACIDGLQSADNRSARGENCAARLGLVVVQRETASKDDVPTSPGCRRTVLMQPQTSEIPEPQLEHGEAEAEFVPKPRKGARAPDVAPTRSSSIGARVEPMPSPARQRHNDLARPSRSRLAARLLNVGFVLCIFSTSVLVLWLASGVHVISWTSNGRTQTFDLRTSAPHWTLAVLRLAYFSAALCPVSMLLAALLRGPRFRSTWVNQVPLSVSVLTGLAAGGALLLVVAYPSFDWNFPELKADNGILWPMAAWLFCFGNTIITIGLTDGSSSKRRRIRPRRS